MFQRTPQFGVSREEICPVAVPIGCRRSCFPLCPVVLCCACAVAPKQGAGSPLLSKILGTGHPSQGQCQQLPQASLALVAGEYSIEFVHVGLGKQGIGQASLCTVVSAPLEQLHPAPFGQTSASSCGLLRAPGLSAPTRVSNASDFSRFTGRLENSNVVCQSFPALGEASAYCEEADYRLPAHYQWR